MDWYLLCSVDERGVLCALQCSEYARAKPLFLHLDQYQGLELTGALEITLRGTETFRFEEELYQAVTLPNKTGRGQLVFLSDTALRAQLFETVLNQLNLGLQIFDRRGHLVFLNETCKRVESLIEQNVLHKHLREIYTVDESYSTMLTTIQRKKPVKNRCDTFANRFGDRVTSINTGTPLYLEGQFYGALGVVLDQDALDDYAAQRDILTRHIEQTRGKAASVRHINRYYNFEDIVGESPAMREAVALARKVAAGDLAVLLLGETGTGKEMFAQSIHSAGPRAGKNFVAINCAAIPASILESTLFGTVKGSFTGSSNQNGLLDEANGGTLFLDEINSMEIQVQSKLLRVLQEKNFRRVGGLKDLRCDFRVIAAMNEPPAAAIAGNRLRKDLYYRLDTVTVEIPPLRERAGDIPVLAEHYLARAARLSGKCITGLTPGAAALLADYDWPGNIRELFHAIDYAVAVTEEDELDVACFPRRLLLRREQNAGGCKKFLQYDLRARLFETERQLLREALRGCGGNVSQAAKSLCLSRQNLQHRLKKCGITPQDEE